MLFAFCSIHHEPKEKVFPALFFIWNLLYTPVKFLVQKLQLFQIILQVTSFWPLMSPAAFLWTPSDWIAPVSKCNNQNLAQPPRWGFGLRVKGLLHIFQFFTYPSKMFAFICNSMTLTHVQLVIYHYRFFSVELQPSHLLLACVYLAGNFCLIVVPCIYPYWISFRSFPRRSSNLLEKFWILVFSSSIFQVSQFYVPGKWEIPTPYITIQVL